MITSFWGAWHMLQEGSWTREERWSVSSSLTAIWELWRLHVPYYCISFPHFPALSQNTSTAHTYRQNLVIVSCSTGKFTFNHTRSEGLPLFALLLVLLDHFLERFWLEDGLLLFWYLPAVVLRRFLLLTSFLNMLLYVPRLSVSTFRCFLAASLNVEWCLGFHFYAPQEPFLHYVLFLELFARLFCFNRTPATPVVLVAQFANTNPLLHACFSSGLDLAVLRQNISTSALKENLSHIILQKLII